jgi:hypothetical protein
VLGQLPVGRKKFVVGRMLALFALEDLQYKSDENSVHCFEAVRELVEADTKVVISDSPPCEDLDRFLLEFPGRIVPRLAQAHQELGRELVAAMSDLFSEYLSAEDDPIRKFCESIILDAATVYRVHSVPQIQLRIVVQREGLVHLLRSDVQVGGVTVPFRGGLEVQISLTGDSFGFAELCALPYVVFHEIVAHAFANTQAISYGGQFQDGWMDVVASRMHQQFVSRYQAAPTELSCLRYPNRVAEYGLHLHGARYFPASRYRMGRRAAERLEQIAAASGRSPEFLWNLSADLNRSSLDRLDREDLVERVASRLTPDEQLVDAVEALAAEQLSDQSLQPAVRFARKLLGSGNG